MSRYNPARSSKYVESRANCGLRASEGFHGMKMPGRPPRTGKTTPHSVVVLAIVFLVALAAFPGEAPSASRNRSLAKSYVVKARTSWNAGNGADALEKVKLALQADSTYAEAFLLMGLIEFQGGNVASSIQMYKKAIALRPSSYSAHYNLALAYLREHRLHDGKLELER